MIQDVQQSVVRARNELRALKTATELAYSSMLMPENAPTRTYNGNIDLTSIRDIMARVTATFTRTDGIEGTPYVDLILNTGIFTFEDWIRSIGGTISGRDIDWGQAGMFTAYVDSTTDTSVTFNIDVNMNVMQLSGVMNDVDFSVKATAISPVQGELVLRRTI